MKFKCKIKDRSTQNALAIRTTSSAKDLPVALGKNYRAIMQFLGQINEEASGAPLVIYHNMDMENLDTDIGIPTSKELPSKEEIKAIEIPAGKYGSCLYTGPYAELRFAYEALAKHIADKGFESTGIAYEMYLSDPSVLPSEKLQTEILFPLKQK